MRKILFLALLAVWLAIPTTASAQVQSIQIGGGGMQALQAAPPQVFVQPAPQVFLQAAPACGVNAFSVATPACFGFAPGHGFVGVNVLGGFGGHRGGLLGGHRGRGLRVKQVQRIRG